LAGRLPKGFFFFFLFLFLFFENILYQKAQKRRSDCNEDWTFDAIFKCRLLLHNEKKRKKERRAPLAEQ